MGIQNYRAIDKDGNIVEFNFKDWKEQSDAGVGELFQVINESDKVAVYRRLEIYGDADYMGPWWWIDFETKTIYRGNDKAKPNGSVKYTDKVINYKDFQSEYRII